MFRCMHRTNIYLDERQTAALDAMARARMTSRAEVIRNLIDDALANGGSTLDNDLDAIRGAFGIRPDYPMPDRSGGERRRYLDSIREQ